MAMLIVDGKARPLSDDDQKTSGYGNDLDALYVGGGSMDDSDWLMPFVVYELTVKRQGPQGSVDQTDLDKADFTVILKEPAERPCTIIKSEFLTDAYKMLIGAHPPHAKEGPYTLNVTAHEHKGPLSANNDIPVDEPMSGMMYRALLQLKRESTERRSKRS